MTGCGYDCGHAYLIFYTSQFIENSSGQAMAMAVAMTMAMATSHSHGHTMVMYNVYGVKYSLHGL